VFWGGVESVISAQNLLPSDFLYHDPHFNTVLPEVPLSRIANCYRPDHRLSVIARNGPADQLEEISLEVAEGLHDTLGIPLHKIGVAGSIAWNAHNVQFSDVNMTVYGLENSWRLYNSFESIVRSSPRIDIRTEAEWSRSRDRLLSRCPLLTPADLWRLFRRRLALCLDGFCVGITPILFPEEAPIAHGSESYETVTEEPVRIIMRIEDDTYGIFLPAILRGVSRPVSSIGSSRVTRIMIYEGAFRGLVRSGDTIEVCGMLQRVHSYTSEVEEEFFQVMVGTIEGAGHEYVRLL